MTEEEKELVSYISDEAKIKPKEMGGSSITFKADGVHLTIYRAGKKMKDIPNSKVLNGWSIEDAVEVCVAIQKQLKLNATNKATSIPLKDRLTAKKVAKATKEVEDESGEWV